MERDIFKKLVEWKADSSRKPLLLYGARQVGKTFILKEFGMKEFSNMVYVNCDKNPTVANLFSRNFEIERILTGLSLIYNEQILPGKTLLFFDEVQEIPEIVSSLKYFYENAPEYCVAAAGSLLGVRDLKNYSFPVGKVDILHLYPMTFVEFLKAMGEEIKAELITDNGNRDLINDLLPVYTDLLRQYYFVGGMPEAVKKWVETKDAEKIRKIQNSIIDGYYADIAKHSGAVGPKCRMILDSIPSQLAKENKKFIYGAMRKGARAKDFENAIQWLCDAGVVYKIPRFTKVAIPLKFYVDTEVFKLFLLDIGLLGAMVESPAAEILTGDKIFSEYKGAFTENYVLMQLKAIESLVIGYFSKENSSLEIDFVVQRADKLYPIEVKAEENVKSKSLRQLVTVDNKDKDLHGYRVSMKGFRDDGWMTNIPLCAINLMI